MAAEARKTENQALPKRVGRYEAFRHLGTGGMARVYLAVQRGVPGQKPELVVVKILRPEAVEDEHVLSLFTEEARIATRLVHPNIIRTREVLAEPPDYLLAMDFQNGQSLLEVLNRIGREAVPLAEHVYVLSKVLAGLTYAHELKEGGRPAGIVHRDVSPANVLVTYSGEVKLLDFGIAKATGALAATGDGVVRGKLGYVAPEQCLGQPADPRSDIYAVGVMLWEAVAKKRRSSGETWQSVMQARLHDAEPKLEEACPDAPPALVAIVRKALARDPVDRYASARAFQTDLEKYLADRKGPPIGAQKIAAMLKPHFDRDRAELQQAVEAFLNNRSGNKNPPVRRLPLPGRAQANAGATGAESPSPVVPVSPEPAATPAKANEEQTAPIPINEGLLTLSRGEQPPTPESSSAPTLPPPAAPAAVTVPQTPAARKKPPQTPAARKKPAAPPATATPRANDVAPPEMATPPAPDVSPSPNETLDVVPVAEAIPLPAAASVATATPLPASAPAPAATRTDDVAFPPPAPAMAACVAPEVTPVAAAPVAAAPKPRVEVDAFGVIVSKGSTKEASAPAWPAVAVPVTTRKKTPVWPFLLLGIAALGLASVFVVPRLGASAPNPAVVNEPAADPTGRAKTSTSTAKVDTVKVRISVDPPDAIVTLDGQPVTGNPFVADLPRDKADHQLLAVADGCKDHQQIIHFYADVALLVGMKCDAVGMRLTGRPGARPAKRPTTAASASAAPSTPPAPETAAAAAPSASAPATPGTTSVVPTTPPAGASPAPVDPVLEANPYH